MKESFRQSKVRTLWRTPFAMPAKTTEVRCWSTFQAVEIRTSITFTKITAVANVSSKRNNRNLYQNCVFKNSLQISNKPDEFDENRHIMYPTLQDGARDCAVLYKIYLTLHPAILYNDQRIFRPIMGGRLAAYYRTLHFWQTLEKGEFLPYVWYRWLYW